MVCTEVDWPNGGDGLYVKDLSSELSTLSIDSDEALLKFHRGQLLEIDELWYRLVPPEAREVLDQKEVQRQSILFELVKSERDYVSDLELVQEVFIDPLRNTLAVPDNRIATFISETFFNINQILAHHQRMLSALFDRQREQFPLVQSLTDIILDNSLKFRQDYEEYIAHYPLAEMRHRNEMRRNQRYQYFLQQCSHNPRVRKRDLITFISRPVTRLPRLLLLLENIKKYTDPDHPDFEAIPLVVGILSDFIKGAQHGIEEAEEKVHFWSLCESLAFQKGEIIDLDLYDAARSLQYQGQLSRRYKSEMNFHWADLHVALLDNYLLLLKPDARPNTVIRHAVVSRPIPLDYLRLAAFDGPPENRKEKSEEGSLGLLDRVRPRYRPMFPFTVYHAAAKMTRRYTLYASSEAERQKWEEVLTHTLRMRTIRQEGNKFFEPFVINDGFFKRPELALVNNPHAVGSHYTGPVTAVTKMYSNGVKFRAVACPSGVYIAQKDEPAFRKVLDVDNPTCLVAIEEVNKFFVLHDYGLCSYSLDLVARAALGMSSVQSVEASRERLATDVVFFRAGKIAKRVVVLYVSRKYYAVVAQLSALEVVNRGDPSASSRRIANGLHSFRPFGESLTIPKDTHNISVFNNHVVVCSENKIQIADPANLRLSGSHRTASFPDFTDAETQINLPMSSLKNRCQSAKPLGLIRCPKYDKDDKDEFLVIYDELGCYTDQHGVPTRNSGYLRWEVKAVSYSYRGDYIILFSPEFIEIRTVRTGKLMQVIEGEDIRRVDVGLLSDGRDATTLVAWKGREERGLVVDTLVELIETAPLQHSSSRASEVRSEQQWADFDEL
ncbi:hypothetical protein DICSQDRAFT_159921 [Dichomitus squalens LYAD-421 SS1]|uniref:uncharacterized protein n=1 Tax=Dichomitus squalens (strain LYAD-421) TaxID=732165 RepID=UPI0004413CA2|nr:uncharacterized protein DICSQDRAFT_159921 [Dichomitus squalens LYAD-421 SS1]EJF64968.1 hypothetical protein DICSQDRAFT_159921 [Dichomitus squalens LYAD-421 SS1]